MKASAVRRDLFTTAGNIENELKQPPAELFNRFLSGGNSSGIDVHQIVPSVGESRARCRFDHGYRCRSIGSAMPGGKTCKVIPAVICCVP